MTMRTDDWVRHTQTHTYIIITYVIYYICFCSTRSANCNECISRLFEIAINCGQKRVVSEETLQFRRCDFWLHEWWMCDTCARDAIEFLNAMRSSETDWWPTGEWTNEWLLLRMWWKREEFTLTPTIALQEKLAYLYICIDMIWVQHSFPFAIRHRMV